MPSQHADTASSALESLLERFGRMVRSVGARHDLAGEDIEELVQEVRIRLWRARGREGGAMSEIGSSYIYRTAVTAALDMIRARRVRQAVPLDSVKPLMAVVGAGDQPDQHLEQEDLAIVVNRAMEGIPASRRPVVRMYLAGYDHREIAHLFGWSDDKARNLLYRGLANLRERLAHLGVTREGWT